MKKETKIIIGGFIITLLVLVMVLFSMYKIFDNREINEEVNNENNIYNTSTDNNTSTINEDNNYSDKLEDNLNYDKAKARMVSIYLFRGEGCPHCEDAIEFFNSIINDYNLNIEIYEVWKNQNNKALMQEVANKTNNEKLNSVPFMVFDNGEYFIGFGDSSKAKIKEKITELSKENDLEFVKNIIDNFALEVNKEEVKKS